MDAETLAETLRIAQWWAKRYAARGRQAGIERSDLRQEAWLAVARARADFLPGRGHHDWQAYASTLAGRALDRLCRRPPAGLVGLSRGRLRRVNSNKRPDCRAAAQPVGAPVRLRRRDNAAAIRAIPARDDAGPPDLAARRELVRMIRARLRRLPAKMRAAMRLHFDTGLTYRDASRRLGMAHNAGQALITEAILRVRHALRTEPLTPAYRPDPAPRAIRPAPAVAGQ
jgi:RNA polymerase sigma factor (sigma-70 family)